MIFLRNDLLNNYSVIKWQLQILLIEKKSVTELYNDMKNEISNLFHLSTFSRFLIEGRISPQNLKKIESFLQANLSLEKILRLFFSQFKSDLPIRKLILNLFNNPDILEVICYKLSKELIKNQVEKRKIVDYILTFPDAVPMAVLLGPKYLNIPYISLLHNKPINESSISVDYKIENEIVRTYYLSTQDVTPNKSFGIILDYIELGNLGKVFWDLVSKPEVRGEIKFLIIIISKGNPKRLLREIEELETYILFEIN